MRHAAGIGMRMPACGCRHAVELETRGCLHADAGMRLSAGIRMRMPAYGSASAYSRTYKTLALKEAARDLPSPSALLVPRFKGIYDIIALIIL
jgi:hypothetical protein